jgi:hypothetical protein
MKVKKTVSYFKIIVFSALYFLTIFIFNEYKAYNLPYGKKANDIRISANIPIIETLMYSKKVNKKLLGNRWVSIRKKPKIGEVIHIWKLAIPEDENGILYEEKDAFRKMEKNGTIYQLNLNTIIKNNMILEQYAFLFEVDNSNKTRKEISGIELDTLIFKWGILEKKNTAYNTVYN